MPSTPRRMTSEGSLRRTRRFFVVLAQRAAASGPTAWSPGVTKPVLVIVARGAIHRRGDPRAGGIIT